MVKTTQNTYFKILTYLFIINILIPLSIMSQEQSQDTLQQKNNFKSKITGQIIDKGSGNSVEYVIIKLFNTLDSSFVVGDITDTVGKFVLKPKAAGKYYMTISLIGFEQKTINAITIDEENKSIDFGEIKISGSSKTLDEVNVVGSYSFKIDIDKKIYRIDTNAISSNGTAGDILQNIPSVFVGQDGTVSLRGGKVKIYVNGKPSGILGISRSQILDYIPASLIESIEVINDPSAKYDADGGSGIINIVLKNQKKPGINAMIIVGAGTGDKYNGSINLNYNFKKIGLFASYDTRSVNMYSWETKNRESDIGNVVKYVNQDRKFFSKTISQNIRFRGEYNFNKKNSLAFSFLNSSIVDVDNSAFRYSHLNNLQVLTKVYDRQINETDKDNSQNYTLNYTRKFKKSQQLLTADLFYSNSKEYTVGDIYQQFYNLDFTSSSLLPLKANTYNLNIEKNMVGQIDYTHPLKKKARIEVGIKVRNKTTDVDYRLENYVYPTDNYLTDTSISKHFRYNLQVNAGYATYRNKFKTFSYKFGLRVEQSIVNFITGTSGINTNQNYFNFFPSAHFLKELKKNNKLTLRYSRRIDRPAFSEINPLQQYNDPLFLNKGNPNLMPEYTNSFDLSNVKSWKQNSISGSVYYRQATGTIQRVLVLDTLGVTVTNFQNLKGSQNIGAEVNVYFQLFKWWRINSSVNYYRNIIDGTNIGSTYKTDTYSWNGKVNTNFTLWKKSILQITANYQAPSYSPFIKNYGQYYMDISFRQDFFKKKMSISLRCADVFHTQKKVYEMNGVNYFISSDARRQSRIFFIGITYRPFGNSKKLNEPKDDAEPELEEENK